MHGIHIERREQAALITIDRPKANALDARASAALYDAVHSCELDPGIRVMVITGAGERFFSAGWDLKAAADGEAADADFGPGGFAGITEYFDRRKPIIAAVNGIAFGGGFELAMACDLVLAATHAQFALPEASLGIIADSGGIIRLPRVVGQMRAAELLMTGRRLDAETAMDWGIVNRVVDAARLREEALALAAEVAANAPLSLAAIREVWQATAHLSERDAFAVLRAGALPIHGSLASSDDAREGIAAFAEKRAPRWTGR